MHFFAIILVPIICLGFLNIRNIEKNYLPLLIIPLIFSLFMSIIPIRSPQHFALIWIPLAVFSAIFFTKLIPQLYFKIKNTQGKIVNTRIPKSLKISIIGVIMIILLLNILFSTVFLVIKFNEVQFENFNELPGLVLNSKNHHGDTIETTQFLKENYPDISNSYVMVSRLVEKISERICDNLSNRKLKLASLVDVISDWFIFLKFLTDSESPVIFVVLLVVVSPNIKVIKLNKYKTFLFKYTNQPP